MGLTSWHRPGHPYRGRGRGTTSWMCHGQQARRFGARLLNNSAITSNSPMFYGACTISRHFDTTNRPSGPTAKPPDARLPGCPCQHVVGQNKTGSSGKSHSTWAVSLRTEYGVEVQHGYGGAPSVGSAGAFPKVLRFTMRKRGTLPFIASTASRAKRHNIEHPGSQHHSGHMVGSLVIAKL